jgi:pyruvate,water dikinase
VTAAVPDVVWIDAAEGAPPGCLGGKFGSLAEMTAAGFDVPPGFGVTTGAFRAFAEATGLVEELRAAADLDRSDLRAVDAASARLRESIEAGAMPASLEAAIRSAYAQLERRTGRTGVPVAVRSSGESEDLEGASFAGQYDTYLWIMGADAVLDHVRRCWAGLVGPQVLTYRPEGGGASPAGALESAAMCVGIQQMVDARAAGVMFTLDPLTGDRSKIVIEGCWGLGEGVVSGDVTPDRFRVDKVTFEVLERAVGAKEQEHRFDAEAGSVRIVDVEPERRAALCLDDDAVGALARLGKAIERHRGSPQDIEWAVDGDGELHLLQVRPETIHSRKARGPIAAGGSAVQSVIGRFMVPGERPKATGGA